MKYNLVKSNKADIDKLIMYKKINIYDYAKDLKKEEIEKINNYVNLNVIKELDNNFNIVINDNVIGCLLLTKKDDGVLLDEIYIEKNYRNKGIGSDILKKITQENNIVYLWVYKLNTRAISLYKRFKFNIIDETENRYYMKYSKC